MAERGAIVAAAVPDRDDPFTGWLKLTADSRGIPCAAISRRDVLKDLGAILDSAQPDVVMVQTFPYKIPGDLLSVPQGLAYLAVNQDGTYKSSFAKFMTENELSGLVTAMEAKAGDLIFFAADKNKVVFDVLGSLRIEIAKQLELIDKDKYNFLWVTEFPLLEYSEEEKRYTAMHHPFTMPMDEDLEYLTTNPGCVRAKAYDIVLNGTEVGGGSVRIFQNDVQEKMFEVLGFTKEEAYDRFGFLLNAFRYGVPPHAGLAFGLDRLVMLMAKEDSIRDVIAFPKVKDASCLMTAAPNLVDDKQLYELGIEVVEQKAPVV
jgi:aspartyl-tRNA synthetase